MLKARFDLSGRVAFVTGGSKGLGAAMARALAAAGADVVLSARHEDELRETLPSVIEGTTARGAYIVGDLSERGQLPRVAEEATSAFGKVDILVNNAGINRLASITDVEDEDWDLVVAINLTAPMILSRLLSGPMKSRGWGRIINVSSIFGEVSRAERDAYSASKAGLLGLTRAMALDLAPYGVTVNAILPGPFETPLTMNLHADAEARRWFTDRVPLGRWGRPEELAGPVLLLASDAGSYMTGTSLIVDGGWLTQ